MSVQLQENFSGEQQSYMYPKLNTSPIKEKGSFVKAVKYCMVQYASENNRFQSSGLVITSVLGGPFDFALQRVAALIAATMAV